MKKSIIAFLMRRSNKTFRIFNKQLVRVIGCLFFLSACHNATEKGVSKQMLAKVGQHILYKEDLKIDFIADLDSAYQIKLYVDDWVKEKIILQAAEKNLQPSEKDFENQLRDYKNSLLKYALERKYVSENLNEFVADSSVVAFYEANKKNFELKENIVKYRSVTVDSKAKKLSQLKYLIRTSKEDQIEKLKQLCKKENADLFIEDSAWVYLDDVLKLFPYQMYNAEHFLRNYRYYETIDSNKISLVFFSDYKIKESTTPLSLETEKIKKIILNQRKQKLIEKMKLDYYNQAYKKGEVTIY